MDQQRRDEFKQKLYDLTPTDGSAIGNAAIRQALQAAYPSEQFTLDDYWDLRNSLIESQEIALHLYVMMGEQQVIVPEGVEVEVTGFVFMGEKKVNVRDVRPRPGVPRLHIRAIGMMGEIKIRTE